MVSLVEETAPQGIRLEEKRCFLGMGFGERMPVDVAALLLVGLETKNYSLLLVDEFLGFNGEKGVETNLKRTRKALDGLSSAYQFKPEILVCSDFMRTEEYGKILREVEERIDERLRDKLLKTVPENRGGDLTYAVNEIACVEFLRREGMEVKVGPGKERVYDEVIYEIGSPIDFGYVIDGYALGSQIPEKIVHYSPNHRGKTNGQRIYLDEPLETSKTKLMMGPEEASKYFLKLASVAGKRLGKESLTEEEIGQLGGMRLKKATKRLVVENILRPYQEVMKIGY